MDAEEILAAEQIAITDERVLAEIAKLKLPEGTKILCDPWIYGVLCGFYLLDIFAYFSRL